MIVELKLPPQDAYYKLQHTIEEVNTLIHTYSQGNMNINHENGNTNGTTSSYRVSPELGNVCFASACHGWSFTLQSFATKYAKRYSNSSVPFNIEDFAIRLWGDWYLDPRTNAITREKPSGGGGVRT